MVLAIADGGTGATTAPAALASLGAANVTLSNVAYANRTITSSQLIQPLCNAVNTYTADIVTGNTSSATTREFMQTIQYTINKGANTSANNRVATYWGVSVNPGAGAAWACNTEMVIQSGSIAAGLTFTMGNEIDLENYDSNCGAAAGSAGFGSPAAYGMSWGTGASTKTLTAATIINTVNDSNRNWQRGHVVYGGVTQESFSDYGNATNSYVDRGSHATGVNLEGGSYTASAIAVPNNSPIVASNSAKTATVEMLRVDTSGDLLLANGSSGVIGICTSAVPTVDNGYQLGRSGQRFSSVWAANGVIQTSDPSLKTEIAALKDVSVLFTGENAVTPISFKWKSGGFDAVEIEEEVNVPLTCDVEVDTPSFSVQDGRAYIGKRRVTQRVPVYEEYPIYAQETGEPVMAALDGRSFNGDDARGINDPSIVSQAIHREVKVVKHSVSKIRLVERPGKRTHVGWDAGQWSHAANLLGLPDFGGFVRADDGTLAIRPDEIIPILWKQVQTLTKELSEMKNMLEDLRER